MPQKCFPVHGVNTEQLAESTRKGLFYLACVFLGVDVSCSRRRFLFSSMGFSFTQKSVFRGYLRMNCMEWSHWASGGAGGMDHMRADFIPWGLLFQSSCCLFHRHHRVTFSAGSDLYSYLLSVVNELCALGQVTNLSELATVLIFTS